MVRRDNQEKIEVPLANLKEKLAEVLETIHQSMFQECEKRVAQKTTIATNMQEFEKNLNENQGYIKAMWCGDAVCEEKIKNATGAKSRCIPFKEEYLSDTCVCCGKPAKHMVVWGRQY